MSENNSPTPPVGPTPPGYDAPEAYPQPSYQTPPPQPYPAQPYGSQPYGSQPYPAQPYGSQPVQGQPQFQQGVADQAGNVALNYWLSVFFSWIPALIFFSTEKGKSGLVDDFNKQNLNFSILRGIVGVLWVIIPGIGFIFGLAALALFIMHIMAAVEAPKRLRNGQPYRFPFNIAFIK